MKLYFFTLLFLLLTCKLTAQTNADIPIEIKDMPLSKPIEKGDFDPSKPINIRIVGITSKAKVKVDNFQILIDKSTTKTTLSIAPTKPDDQTRLFPLTLTKQFEELENPKDGKKSMVLIIREIGTTNALATIKLISGAAPPKTEEVVTTGEAVPTKIEEVVTKGGMFYADFVSKKNAGFKIDPEKSFVFSLNGVPAPLLKDTKAFTFSPAKETNIKLGVKVSEKIDRLGFDIGPLTVQFGKTELLETDKTLIVKLKGKMKGETDIKDLVRFKFSNKSDAKNSLILTKADFGKTEPKTIEVNPASKFTLSISEIADGEADNVLAYTFEVEKDKSAIKGNPAIETETVSFELDPLKEKFAKAEFLQSEKLNLVVTGKVNGSPNEGEVGKIEFTKEKQVVQEEDTQVEPEPDTDDTDGIAFKSLPKKEKIPLDIDKNDEFTFKITNIPSASEIKNIKESSLFKGDGKPIPSPEISEPKEESNAVKFVIKDASKLFNGNNTTLGFQLIGKINDATKTSVLAKFTVEKPETQIEPVAKEEDTFLNAIVGKFPKFKKDKIFKDNGVTYIFLNPDLKVIPGTLLPDCNKNGSSYKIIYLTTDDAEKLAVKFTERAGPEPIAINNGGSSSISAQFTEEIDQETVIFKESEISVAISEGVTIEIEVDKKTATYIIDACNQAYHVTIAAGFFASTLNYPDNITQQNGKGTTLFADNPTSQKALTVMALFYPRPRDPLYSYKSLDFWQKWSFSFGTKLSENIFDDFLLGLNFEFSKGGNFTAGAHYGQHRIVRGDQYKNFRFGKDIFQDEFNNSMTNLRWDFGFFAGVTIDLKIVNALRGAQRTQRAANEKKN